MGDVARYVRLQFIGDLQYHAENGKPISVRTPGR
jgi:hypothetical protein